MNLIEPYYVGVDEEDLLDEIMKSADNPIKRLAIKLMSPA